MTDTDLQISMFDRIGGLVTVDRLVEAFYSHMDTLAPARAIRAMHAADLEPTKQVLKRYLTEWLGGPKLYTPQKGHPRLRQRHMGFTIGEPERDAWLLCMRAALDETVIDPVMREEIYASFARLADWMRNTAGNPHDTGATRP